jgi:hypothetical protein
MSLDHIRAVALAAVLALGTGGSALAQTTVDPAAPLPAAGDTADDDGFDMGWLGLIGLLGLAGLARGRRDTRTTTTGTGTGTGRI